MLGNRAPWLGVARRCLSDLGPGQEGELPVRLPGQPDELHFIPVTSITISEPACVRQDRGNIRSARHDCACYAPFCARPARQTAKRGHYTWQRGMASLRTAFSPAAGPMPFQPYNRNLLKLSGEVLMGEGGLAIDPAVTARVAVLHYRLRRCAPRRRDEMRRAAHGHLGRWRL